MNNSGETMNEPLGKVLGNTGSEFFKFVSTRYSSATFVVTSIIHNGVEYKIVGEVTKTEAINSQFERPEDVRYISNNDKGIRAKTIFVFHVEILATLNKGEITDLSMPPVPGSNMFKAEESDIRIALRLSGEGIDLGAVKEHQFKIKLSYKKLLRTHISIVGQTGSGKSYLATKLAIELLKKKKKESVPSLIAIPLIFDTSGEYSGKIETDQSRLNEVLNVISSKEQVFPLLHEKYLWLLNEMFDIDYKFESQLKNWLYKPKLMTTDAGSGNTKKLPFDEYGGDENKKFIQEFSQSRISSINQLANKIDEFWNKYNIYNPKNQMVIPHKALSSMRRSNLKIKKNVDFEFLEQLGNGLIVDLSTRTDLIERQMMMKLYLNQLLGAARSGRFKRKIVLFIDEAHNYAPSVYKSYCKDEILTIAREGRKYDLTLCLISQRPRWVDPTALSQCGNTFILRIQNSEDQRHLFDSASLPDKIRDLNIARLKQGEVIVVGDVMENPICCAISEIDYQFIDQENERIRESRKK